jgi:hypothetical protein
MIYYGGRLFRPLSTSDSGETSAETIFRYQQKGDVLTGDYSGGAIEYGHLIGIVDERGHINMRYHHVNDRGFLMTGRCKSRPEVLENGKLRLHERWQWTCGDRKRGTSVIEEI